MESRPLPGGRLLAGMVNGIGVAMFLYHMLSTQYLVLGSFEHQNIHLAFALVLTFLSLTLTSRRRVLQIAAASLATASVIVTGYVHLNMAHIEELGGYPEPIDVLIGVVILVLVLEATRQAWGATLPIVAIVFIGYFLWGHLIPGPLNHRAFNFDFIISYIVIGLTGVYGNFLSISANMVFLFVVFGAVMKIARIDDFLFETGKLVGRYLEGGPGQTAVVSSSLVGMVTGAAVANVAITGAYTIPYMKRVGYRPELAGAIEATASTGGQLMPPVMGAAAFMMAFFLGVPYTDVMLAGILPAVFFYLAVIVGVQLISVAENIRPPREMPDYWLIARRLPNFLVPLAVIVTLLLMRYSPMLSAFWAIVTTIGIGVIRKETRPSLGNLVKALGDGATTGAKIGVSLATVGVIAQTLITTGLGGKLAGLVEALSGGNLVPALVITMVVSLILGCGVPPVAAYGLVAMVAVPPLIKMGVAALPAHFFAFYFAIISAVTPPVAMGALAGAGIAGAGYFRTSVHAFKLAISGFIIPYFIVFNPILTLHVESPAWAIGSLISIPIALLSFTMVIYGVGLVRLSRGEWLLSLVVAAAMFGYNTFRHIEEIPVEYPLFSIGLVLFAVMLALQVRRMRRESRKRVAVQEAPTPTTGSRPQTRPSDM